MADGGRIVNQVLNLPKYNLVNYATKAVNFKTIIQNQQ
jgi:hypothetical protein